MTGEWTPLIAGLFGALTGGIYLAGVHLLPKWRNRRGVAHSVDAGPVSFHFKVSQPSVTVKPPPWSKPILRLQSVWRRRIKPVPRRKSVEAWRFSKGDGYSAAKLIMLAPTVEEARKIYNSFRVAPRRNDVASANWAFLYRLGEAGLADEVDIWSRVLDKQNEDFFLHEKVHDELKSLRREARE